ncbi:hypothetical protein LAZ40_00870 [Cereibacter sphaeroides]|uniref:hypothetical protein n=1 Tax=Cereibacter sphaeroides TaxID=1063 RepID=UPI001F426F4D|nr:hypothetical protein [Cereibacter sphaeroides]MCE6957622.1 hypothetical protein [Cereibacter sphaeroides]MCE6971280.1 hypothetical protein [Cereibacter sphaeroides]
MMIDVKFSGILRTETPFAVIPPNAVEISKPDGSRYRQIARRSLYRDGLRVSRPVVPGSTLRGRLRRSAMEVIFAITGQKWTLAEFHQNAIGGIKGAESEEAFDVVFRSTLREKNPILGLFGAGSPWMLSHVQMTDAIPLEDVETDVIGGVRTDDGRRDQGFFRKLQPEAAAEWRALVGGNAERTRIKAEVKRLRAELRNARGSKDDPAAKAAETALRDLQAAAVESEILATNPVSLPLQHEAMPAGVEMSQDIDLMAVTDAEAGLFLLALNHAWARRPNFGQHGSLGYGLISAEYRVSIADASSFDPFSIAPRRQEVAVVRLQPQVGIVDPLPSELQACVDAFREQFSGYDFRVSGEIRT